MQITDHLKIEIQHFVEIPALCSGFGKDHWKMKAYRTDVKSSHKHRNILIICRIHTASLVPGA